MMKIQNNNELRPSHKLALYAKFLVLRKLAKICNNFAQIHSNNKPLV